MSSALIDLSRLFTAPRLRSRPAESRASASNAARYAARFICATASRSAARDREHANKQPLKGAFIMR